MMGAIVALLFLLGGALAACSSGGSGTLSGTVASVDSAASSFTLNPKQSSANTANVTVHVDSGTEFRGTLHGLTDLAVGMLVKVQGSAGSNAFTATQVENEDQNEDREEFKGTVGVIHLANAAFDLKLADGSTQLVITDAETEFEGTLHQFADLATGQRVEVKGAVQADNSILAASVEGENEDEVNVENAPEVEGTGKVLSVGSHSFVMQLGDRQVTVTVSSATDFDGDLHSLADLKVGMLVEIRGQLQSNGAIAATRVHGEDDHNGSGSGSGSGGGTSGHGGDDPAGQE